MSAIANMARLTKAGAVLAWSGARVLPDEANLPGPLALFARVTAPLRKNGTGEGRNETKLSDALTSLGPSYIKLGQFLATRDDIIGRELARDLSTLQDRLPPFSQSEARAAVEEALGAPIDKIYAEFGPPVAAASIAQVHKARLRGKDGALTPVAVKVLRPGIEQRFQKDLDSYFFAARMIERFHPPSRRLRPIAVVDTLAKSVAVEMDLRMEAAAISEMAQNTKNDEGFRVPTVDWSRSARRALTLEWIDGISIADREALAAAGHDLKALGSRLVQAFLRHAMRDGFFHADMHPGNLFVDAEGRHRRRRFRHHGPARPQRAALPRRNPLRLPHPQLSPRGRGPFRGRLRAAQALRGEFAQALRAIGEPIHGRPAERDFHGPAARPAVPIHRTVRHADAARAAAPAEDHGGGRRRGARSLDPELNIWVVSEPVVKGWIEKEFGTGAQFEAAAQGAATVGRLVGDIPKFLGQAERTAEALSAMAEEGLRLDDHTVERLAEAQGRQNRASRIGIWVGALALARGHRARIALLSIDR